MTLYLLLRFSPDSRAGESVLKAVYSTIIDEVNVGNNGIHRRREGYKSILPFSHAVHNGR
jgi:hypothetical protein